MDTKVKIGFFLCVLGVLGGGSALKQGAAAAQQSPAAADSGAELLVGVEARRDRFQYHFDNPSSIDTSFLVPHFFEQRYIADNLWAVLTVRYTAGVRWETCVGATPQRTARADDYDTFFDPDGTVWVGGTTGGATMRAFRISQQAHVGRAGPVRFVAAFRFRLDMADFQLGHKTERRNGVLVLATDTTAPETASSQLRELLFGAVASLELAPHWRLMLDGESSPLSVGRLLIRLPEKYPGQDLTFIARIVTASGRATLARHGVGWPIEVSVDAGRTWSYKTTDRLAYDRLGVRATIGKAW